ncbi:hypothetical protein RchiOBHm_Chr3g0488791 [Rosa chinensis]|nr:hypothetical protein RchiOBHm_Chr3g0488791 [Rosa chinensis]
MSYWRGTFCVATDGWEYHTRSNVEGPTFKTKSEFQPIRGWQLVSAKTNWRFQTFANLRFLLMIIVFVQRD